MNSDLILQTENVSKFFLNHPAVIRVTIDICEGSLVVIVGPNGSGKTTFLKLLTGLLAPTSGEIRFRERPIRRSLRAYRSRIGLLPDHGLLYQQLELSENLNLIARMFDISLQDIAHIASRVGLDPMLEFRGFELSKGTVQKAMLAVFEAMSPELLFLDEPFTGLDQEGQDGLVNFLLNRQRSRRTSILVTHFFPPVDRIWNQLLVFKNGRLAANRFQDKPHDRISTIWSELSS